jgi:putative ABC transport system permease protein
MDSVATHIAQANPKSNKGWGVFVEPLKNDFLPSERKQTLWLLLGAVAFILLIACVNVANLLLARDLSRQKELAVRSALGTSRRTIFEQLITESLLLAIAGGLLGIGVGYAMLQGLVAIMPRGTLPDEADLTLNLPILFFTLAATTLAGLLFGSAPAWYASRVDPGEALKEGNRSGVGAGRHRLLQTLVIGEFALALALLAGAGLRARLAPQRPREDHRLLQADFLQRKRRPGRHLSLRDDWPSSLRRGLWHAVYHRRKTCLQRPLHAP